MTWIGSARDEVLLRIRRQLYGAREPASGANERVLQNRKARVVTELSEAQERVARFRELLEKVGGQVHEAANPSGAGAKLAQILAASNVKEVACSDAALTKKVLELSGVPVRTFDGWADRRRLFECDLGLSCAQWGIAETGTLVLDSSQERHRLVSLVPPVHVAILRLADLRATLGQVLLEAQTQPGGLAPTLTFITGPSRTADIELTLVVGVHGPRALHVLLLESD